MKSSELDWHQLFKSEKTLIMGILNLTPDSFSDGGQFIAPETAQARVEQMIAEGADFIDLGAESTRPGAAPVSAEAELERLLPILDRLLPIAQKPISVDTYKASIAQAVLERGVPIINDIWGLQRDEAMAATIAEYGAGVVIMHNQAGTEYPQDIIETQLTFFRKSIDLALDAGIQQERIVLDPGIGFGKTTEHNLEVLARLPELSVLGYPLLLGTSRKSVIGNTLNLPVDQRLEGTLATNVLGIADGISIIRVHDIQAHRRAVDLTDAILRYRKNG